MAVFGVQLVVALRSLPVQWAGNDVMKRSEDEVGASETWTIFADGVCSLFPVMTPA